MTNSKTFSEWIIHLLPISRTRVTISKRFNIHLETTLIYLKPQPVRWEISLRNWEAAKALRKSIIPSKAACTTFSCTSHLRLIQVMSTVRLLRSEIFLMTRSTSKSRMNLISRELTKSWSQEWLTLKEARCWYPRHSLSRSLFKEITLTINLSNRFNTLRKGLTCKNSNRETRSLSIRNRRR